MKNPIMWILGSIYVAFEIFQECQESRSRLLEESHNARAQLLAENSYLVNTCAWQRQLIMGEEELTELGGEYPDEEDEVVAVKPNEPIKPVGSGWTACGFSKN